LSKQNDSERILKESGPGTIPLVILTIASIVLPSDPPEFCNTQKRLTIIHQRGPEQQSGRARR